MNFEVIKESVFYARSIVESKKTKESSKITLSFDMTTNGLLLDDDKIEFLIKNDFWLAISLDGPPEIHDKNKGKGTFQKIMEIVKGLNKKYPDCYQKRVSFSIVYAKDTDLKKVKDFFSQEIFEKSFELIFGDVVDTHSSLIFPFKGTNESLVIKEIKEKLRKGDHLAKIEAKIIQNYFRMNSTEFKIRTKWDYGLHCLLGSKTLFVTVDGDFYGCERTGKSFRIGDMKNGFDIQRIIKFEKKWENKTLKKCKDCPVQGICTACIASTGFNGRIILKEFCHGLKKNYREKVKEYIEFKKIQ